MLFLEFLKKNIWLFSLIAFIFILFSIRDSNDKIIYTIVAAVAIIIVNTGVLLVIKLLQKIL